MTASESTAIKATYFSIASNLVLALTKGVAGVLGNSYALIADATESATDVVASLFVLLGLRYARRPADDNHPYGHGKIEPLITFLVVGFLVGSAVLIAYQSIKNIFSPQQMPKPWTLVVLAVIIVWKEISYRIVKRKGEQANSSAVQADAWHHRSDAITSVMAFLGIGVAVVFGEQYAAADDWAALLASGFILYNSYLIFRPALGEVMDEHLYDDVIADIRRISLTVPGVRGTEKCYVRKAGMQYFVDLHAIVDGTISVAAGHEIAHRLKDKLLAELPTIGDVLVHIEPE